MIALQGQPGELRMTLEITRAATGKTETVELVGFVDEDELARIQQETTTNGSSDAEQGE